MTGGKAEPTPAPTGPSTKCVILCAGLGTRMQPLTFYVNKGLVPIGGRPILEHIITKLVAHGIAEFYVAVSHLGEQVEHYFGTGERFGARIHYVYSTEPLGTAGELHKMRDVLLNEEHFLVHYGDILTNLDSARLLRQHLETGATATIGLVTGIPIHTGLAQMDGEGRLTHFEEKPKIKQPCHAAVSVFSRRVLDYVQAGDDLAANTIPAMMAAGEDVRGMLDETAFWHDVGRLSDIEAARSLV